MIVLAEHAGYVAALNLATWIVAVTTPTGKTETQRFRVGDGFTEYVPDDEDGKLTDALELAIIEEAARECERAKTIAPWPWWKEAIIDIACSDRALRVRKRAKEPAVKLSVPAAPIARAKTPAVCIGCGGECSSSSFYCGDKCRDSNVSDRTEAVRAMASAYGGPPPRRRAR